MIAREISNGKTLLIRQPDHADLASQFAAHWGNGPFATLDPASSMVFAAAHHDDHYRDIEAVPLIDSKRGRPFGHRETPERAAHIEALRRNLVWLEERDAFAALMVSMHHSGLPQNRYGAVKLLRIGSAGGDFRREITPEKSMLIKQLESDQRAAIERRDLDVAHVKLCYIQLQVFDLLSLYFCCDGFAGDKLCAAQLDQAQVAGGPNEAASISITPLSEGTVRISPYPFDLRPLNVVVMGREVRPLMSSSDEKCRDEFERAPRVVLTWTLTD